jgi:hypothetical protein
MAVVWKRESRWSRFLDLVWPARRRRREREFREHIRWLLEHPDEPVYFRE